MSEYSLNVINVAKLSNHNPKKVVYKTEKTRQNVLRKFLLTFQNYLAGYLQNSRQTRLPFIKNHIEFGILTRSMIEIQIFTIHTWRRIMETLTEGP